MKISTKGEYGIRAMLYIGMHGDEGPVTSHEIAQHQGIPEPYLRQILALLSKDRLIQSNRGPQGGHVLGRPASAITLRAHHGLPRGADHRHRPDPRPPLHHRRRDRVLRHPRGLPRGQEGGRPDPVQMTLEELVNRQREILAQRISVPLDLPSQALLPVLRD